MLQAITCISGTGVALAGVEPPVGGETRIDRDSHQPGLSPGEQVAEVGIDGLNRAVGNSTAQHARPLGEQHRPIGREGDVPGDGQAGDKGGDPEIGRGNLVTAYALRLLEGTLRVVVGRRGSQVQALVGAGRRVAGRRGAADVRPSRVPVRRPGPLPGRAVHVAVGIAQARTDGRPDLGEAYRSGFLHVAHGDGDRLLCRHRPDRPCPRSPSRSRCTRCSPPPFGGSVLAASAALS